MLFGNFNKKMKNILNDKDFQDKLAEEKRNAEVANNNNETANEYNEETSTQEVDVGEVITDRKTIFDDLVKEDKEFSEAAFKAKADNIFIQLYTAVMKQDLQRVKHFLADNVYEKYERKVNDLKANNVLQIYDELNVSDTDITNVEENDVEFKLYVSLLTKYLDYTINKDTRAFIRGNRDVRTERRINLVFTKLKSAKELKAARTCPNCGANLDINKTGVCPYCGSIFELKNYDWILTEIND